MQTKEYDLTLAVFQYAASCLVDGEFAMLRDLNFSEQEVAALQDLSLGDIAMLADRLNGHALTIHLDRQRFWLVLAQIEQERATEQLKNEMVRREAPAAMMQELFGITDREYTALRRRNHRPRCAGRPPDPDDETKHVIWEAWQNQGGRAGLSASDWLSIADKSRHDLRTVWRFVRDAQRLEHRT